MDTVDVVIVGGGIAGAGLAALLAPHGITALVLERVAEHRDLVRGELMHPWGSAELLRLGFADTLLQAGGGFADRFVFYDEDGEPAAARDAAIPLDRLLAGTPGSFCVGHPAACTALLQLAEQRGAHVRRSVTDIEVLPSSTPIVSFGDAGTRRSVTCRLVVGADGRRSTVRTQLGLPLEEYRSGLSLGGMLVHCPGWDARTLFSVSCDDAYLLAFPRPDDLIRLYICRSPESRVAAPERPTEMLQRFNRTGLPGCDQLHHGTVAGPCHYVDAGDAWVDRPVAPGVVLAGDAAGWSDPVSGQGLSVALRDIRLISDTMLQTDDWSPDAFDGYVDERRERMRRLRAENRVLNAMRCTFGTTGKDRRHALEAAMADDPLARAPLAAIFAGPETVPDTAFDDARIDALLALT